MRINPYFIKFNYTFQKPSLTRQPIKDEFVSFRGKSLNAQKKSIGEGNIPERVLKRIDEVIETQGKYADASIYDIHKEVYGRLLACTSLAQAKKLYPEFESVKDLAQEKFQEGTVGSKIQNFKYEGLNPDDASLIFLKKLYYHANSLRNKEDYFGISKTSLISLLDSLNIKPFETKYANYLQYNNPKLRSQLSQRAQDQWDDEEGRGKLLPHLQDPSMKEKNAATLNVLRQDPDFEKKRTAFFATEEWRERMSEISKGRWEDPAYAEGIARKMREIWEDPDRRAEQAEKMKKLWTDEEYRAIQAETREALKLDPSYRERFSEAAKKRWEDPDYRAKTSAALKARYDDPKYVERTRQIGLKNWQNPEYVEKQQPIIKARKAAWDEMEDVKAIMKKLAAEFPRLGKILAKADNGQKLTDEEEAYHLLYFTMFNELCPDFRERFSKLLHKWVAYYKDNEA